MIFKPEENSLSSSPVLGSSRKRGNPSYNKGQPRACGNALALQAPKWLRTGARQFALSFGLAQRQITLFGRNLFADPQLELTPCCGHSFRKL